jgi:hypothetical protein
VRQAGQEHVSSAGDAGRRGGGRQADTDALSTLLRCREQCVAHVDECKGYRNAYVICKRGQFDMRSRIQGLKGT